MRELPSKFAERFRTMDVLTQHRGSLVTKSWDQTLERPVIIKSLTPVQPNEVRSVERFLREAQVLGRLHHPGVVRVYDFGYAEESNLYYLITEFIEGSTLATQILLHSEETIRNRLDFLRKVVESLRPILRYVHRRGIIHRDLKPQNIVIRKPFDPVLVDFGISLDLRKDRITNSGSLIGTPLYLAPEQINDEEKLDHRVDVYALGLIFFEILCGKTAYSHDDPIRLIVKRIEEPVPSLSDHGITSLSGVNRILMKAMAKEREQRFNSVPEFFDALISALNRTDENSSQSEVVHNNLEHFSRPEISKQLQFRDYLILVDSRSALIDKSLFMLEHLADSLTPYDDDGLDILFSGHHIDILSRLAQSKSTLEIQGQSPWGFVTLPIAIERILTIYVENVKAEKYTSYGKKGFSAVVVMDDQIPQGEIQQACEILEQAIDNLPQPEAFFISFLTGEHSQASGSRYIQDLVHRFPGHVGMRREIDGSVSLDLAPPDDNQGVL